MAVTIYADTLVFINIFVTYFLLVTTVMLCRREIRRGRILLASAAGGIYALTILLPRLSVPVNILLRVVMCILLCRIACRFRDTRSFLRLVGTFLLVNFLFAGGITALQMIPGMRKILYTGGVVYADLHVPALLGATVVCYVLVRLCLRLYGSAASVPHLATVTAENDGARVRVQALMDTGLQLSDPFSGKDVLLFRTDAAQKLVPPTIRPFLVSDTTAEFSPQAHKIGLRLFPYQSAAGSGLLPAFRCAHAEIVTVSGKITLHDFYIAVSNTAFRGSTYDALVPGDVYSRIQGGFTNESIPKHLHSAAADTAQAVRAQHPLHTWLANAPAAAAQKRGRRCSYPARARR